MLHQILLWTDRIQTLFTEPQRTTRGPIPMTLGWHRTADAGASCLFKEGGGGGFHCLMRLYPAQRIGTIVMTNATGVDVAALLDSVDPLILETAAQTADAGRSHQ